MLALPGTPLFWTMGSRPGSLPEGGVYPDHPWKGGLATFRLLPGSGGDCSTCLSSSRRLAWLAVIPWSPRQQERASFNVQMFVLSHFSRVWCSVTPWTMATQAPPSMGFPKQEYWNELSFPSPGDLPNPGIEPESLLSPALAGGFLTTSITWEAHILIGIIFILSSEGFGFKHY